MIFIGCLGGEMFFCGGGGVLQFGCGGENFLDIVDLVFFCKVGEWNLMMGVIFEMFCKIGFYMILCCFFVC